MACAHAAGLFMVDFGAIAPFTARNETASESCSYSEPQLKHDRQGRTWLREKKAVTISSGRMGPKEVVSREW
eukprot:1124435-Pyramimonas_sp.AAC.1